MKTLIDKKKREKPGMGKKEQDPALQLEYPDALISKAFANENEATKNGSQKKDEKPGKTIETMFRITSANSQKLSDQADTKAHIMITVNSIIVSIVFTRVIEGYGSQSSIPFIALIAVSLLTIAFAVLATRPNIPQGSFTNTDLKEKKTNLLFFGNFYKMKFEDYSNGMLQVMNDKHFLYLSLLRDVYCQGVVLGRKYKMLKVAYNVFLWGLIGVVSLFAINTGG